MARKMEGKTMVVTGGAGGLGLAIACDLALEGAAVGIIDLDGDGAARAEAQLVAKGARSLGVGADVADWAGVEEAMRRIEISLGPIDGLVNNAGVAALGSVHEADEQSWRRVLDVNVSGVFLASKAVLPGMLDRRSGSILNVASVAGLVGIHNMAAYCASKGAIISLTRQMAVDYAKWGIRVNAIAPGTIASTDMGERLLHSDQSPEARAGRLAKYPMGRYATPAEISRAALFMIDDSVPFLTGTIMAVDGGMTAL
jgi:NAD(P)-dependent dehydrogenase (short-subunit alcohol dehydrogenase family)